MAPVRLHPVIESLLIAGGAACLAFVLAVAASGIGAGPVAKSLAPVVVVVALFAWRPIDGLLAFGLVVLFADTVEFWSGGDARYFDELAIVGLAVTTLVMRRHRWPIGRPGWREAALGVMFAAGVASSLLNGVSATIWVPGLGLLAKGFAFFYVTKALRVDVSALQRITGVAFAVGIAVVLVGLVQLAAPEFAASALGVPPYDQQRGSLQVVNSVFTHPALYGWLAAFLALFLFSRFAVRREWWALLLAVLLAGASLLSGRRTPVLGLLGGLAIGGIRQSASRRASRRVWAAVAGSVLLVAVLSIPLLGDFYRGTLNAYLGSSDAIGEIFADDPDREVIRPLQARVALYAGSVAVARDELPLGAGIGRYASHMSRESYSPVYETYGLDKVYGLRERRPIAVTDTFWPMILGETGIIGLLAALAFFGLVGLDLWRAASPIGIPTVRIFTLGALMVYVEALMRSLTSGVFVAPPVVYWVFGAAALSLALRRQLQSATTSS
jgi:hypothetical protein